MPLAGDAPVRGFRSTVQNFGMRLRSDLACRRGIAADHEMRQDTNKLRDYLRGEEHDSTVFPKWDANSQIMPVSTLPWQTTW